MNLNYTIRDIVALLDADAHGDLNGRVNDICIDSRSPLINQASLFITLKGQKVDGQAYCQDFINKGGKIVLVSRPIDLPGATQIIVKDTLAALQKMAANHRAQFQIPVIGITGSNGKTTVKEWLYHVLKSEFHVIRSPKSYNSQIGVPLSVLEMNHTHQLAIFEAGISQPGEMQNLADIIKPTIGIFTGIGDAHQNHFQSLTEKQAEKFKLFEHCKTLISSEKVDQSLIPIIPFQDRASQLNATLVMHCAQHLKISDSTIISGLKTLPKISMRMERMEGNWGNILINDAYTFDEKGFEIGLYNLDQNAKNLNKVLVLAPNDHFIPSSNFVQLIENSAIDHLVWIHPIPIDTKVNTSHFKTVHQYNQSPIQFKQSAILFSGSRQKKLETSIPFYQLKKHITKLEIDLNAIRHNLNYYRQFIGPNTQILAMVKAQSYGGGSTEMANFLSQEKIDYLGVAYADEGMDLRTKHIDLPIIVMNPELAAFDDIIDYQLEPSIYSLEILNQFIHQLILKGKKQFPIHLKLDTGMHRLGFQANDINELIDTINAQPEVYVKTVFSHFAAADDPDEIAFTTAQFNQFKTLTAQIKTGIGYNFKRHICNSEGTFTLPAAHLDMVRVGIGLFGLIPHKTEALTPAISFKTQISQIRIISENESVGYGRKHITKKQSKIGVIPVGYADGLPRALSHQKWQVKINGQFAPIIGTICMDMCMVDLSKIEAKTGDTVEIFGWQGSIAKMADTLNTISYEIISTISSRVHRVYID